MKKIDITTTQNVTIEYELASVGERALASIIDVIVILLVSSIIYGIVSLMAKYNFKVTYFYILFPCSFLYHLFMETLHHGQSIGKKIIKIRVVKITGERPGFFDFLMRTAFRFIDITSTSGALALIIASSSEKGQRLGDFFADTTVIKLLNINRFSLKRILSMEQLKNYEPSYPGVIKFKEEEMLLIKETIDRYTKYPNDKHFEAFTRLVKKIEEQLQVTAPQNKIVFLNTLVKDYVCLTR